jgi:hypothetical protein
MTKSAKNTKIAPNVAIAPANLSKEFKALESKIRAGLKSWEIVGECLNEIIANSYYTERGFKTFESYVEAVFDISRDYAYKIARAQGVVVLLRENGIKPAQLPANESQVRPLCTIAGDDSDEKVVNAYKLALSNAKKGKISARLVKEAVDEITGKGKAKKDADDKGANKGADDTGNASDKKSTGDDLPDTSADDEIARLTQELAEARQRAATAEAKLAAVSAEGRAPLSKLQRDMILAGFKALAKSADAKTKSALASARNELLC